MELIRKGQENFVVCPGCGYRVPRTPVCIRCGFDLSNSKLTSKPPPVPHAASTPSEAGTEKRPESNVGRLLNYVIWRAKIVWLLLEGKVSKEIFEKIYRDYTSKINSLLASEGGLTNLMDAFSVVSRLREAKRNLDELMVRHRIGEVSDREYISNYTALMSELSVLEREAVKAEFQYNHLKRVIVPRGQILIAQGADREVLRAASEDDRGAEHNRRGDSRNREERPRVDNAGLRDFKS
ncbi:hypothetical protein CW711_07075 [Candidatus Bathyarchaeota archaeon]|nr:MAG: hypothetical protein CW711_07075 [Candidatus Bathyarchaeota archaeon]